jgi:hypothetical protein
MIKECENSDSSRVDGRVAFRWSGVGLCCCLGSWKYESDVDDPRLMLDENTVVTALESGPRWKKIPVSKFQIEVYWYRQRLVMSRLYGTCQIGLRKFVAGAPTVQPFNAYIYVPSRYSSPRWAQITSNWWALHVRETSRIICSCKEYVRRVTARPRITFSLPVTEHPQVEIMWNFQNYTTTKSNFATKATRYHTRVSKVICNPANPIQNHLLTSWLARRSMPTSPNRVPHLGFLSIRMGSLWCRGQKQTDPPYPGPCWKIIANILRLLIKSLPNPLYLYTQAPAPIFKLLIFPRRFL